jgi:hypothetical protein
MAYGLGCLLTIGQFTIDLAHWVFAIKFWDLSLKLKASVQNKEHKASKLSAIIFYSFILVLLVLSAVFLWTFIRVVNEGIAIKNNSQLWTFFRAWAWIYGCLPCFTSLGFLSHGYIQFFKIPKGLLFISNRKMFLHLICYALICAAGVMFSYFYTFDLMIALYHANEGKLYLELSIIVLLTFSNLPLIFIVYTIILESKKQLSHST